MSNEINIVHRCYFNLNEAIRDNFFGASTQEVQSRIFERAGAVLCEYTVNDQSLGSDRCISIIATSPLVAERDFLSYIGKGPKVMLGPPMEYKKLGKECLVLMSYSLLKPSCGRYQGVSEPVQTQGLFGWIKDRFLGRDINSQEFLDELDQNPMLLEYTKNNLQWQLDHPKEVEKACLLDYRAFQHVHPQFQIEKPHCVYNILQTDCRALPWVQVEKLALKEAGLDKYEFYEYNKGVAPEDFRFDYPAIPLVNRAIGRARKQYENQNLSKQERETYIPVLEMEQALRITGFLPFL